MTRKLFCALLSAAVIAILLSTMGCALFGFVQPSVIVNTVELDGLPGVETTNLLVRVTIQNNDTRGADITRLEYTVVIEDVSSNRMDVDLNRSIPGGGSIDVVLPLAMPTTQSSAVLARMQKGAPIEYEITGTIYIDNAFANALPLDVRGETSVSIGYEEYFSQPEIEVENFTITAIDTTSLLTSSTVTVTLDARITVTNTSEYAAVISSIDDYVVGVGSASSVRASHTESFFIGAGGTANAKHTLNITAVELEGVSWTAAWDWYTAQHVSVLITGRFTATADIGEGDTVFVLPLRVVTSIEMDVEGGVDLEDPAGIGFF